MKPTEEKQGCSWCGKPDPDGEYNDAGECLFCVAVGRWGELDNWKFDLLMEAFKERGKIRPLPGHEDFDNTHFTVNHYRGKTVALLWCQNPADHLCPDSTSVFQRGLPCAS